ncbi:hypothetical protein NQ314_017642 [Rhamnusium bicolor]|uniref:Uncharacterized protein n=1 Tax=Rhamnusium bicolor TaxID=1586634 RepID=A0AAV8WTA8_9CUCU|nr:hypothetical protein NQ314_017642 [Rhamnusium bicolor]
MNTGLTGDNIYDFSSDENSSKWKGLLTAALKKSTGTSASLSWGTRRGTRDVEYRVQSTFPTPIDKWALKEAQEALERGKKKSVLQLPVDKIHYLLQKVYI